MRVDFSQGNLVEAFVRQRKSKTGWLDEIDRLVAWPDLVCLFDHVYASSEGGASYPIETYIKLLLLQQWYGLSDEGLEAAVDDRLSFRRFCGIPLDRPVPDHSSIWRLRQHLTRKDKDGISLGERLLAAINEQLDRRGLVLRRGTLIDASIVRSAARPPKGDGKGGVGEVSPVDPDAGFTKKSGKTLFGYKAHVGVDEGSDLIRQAIMTSASIHDSQAGDALIQGDEDAVYADKAYDDDARRARLKAAGIKAQILYKARRNQPLRPWQKAFNKVVAAIRAPVERTFAAMKGPYGFARCRAFGLARNDAHLQLFAGAFNLKTALGQIR
jgi:IS5 family transposase